MGSWVQKTAAALIALALVASPTASAQPDLRDFLTQQLDNQEPDNAERGFAHAVGPLSGMLASSRAAQLPLTPSGGLPMRSARSRGCWPARAPRSCR